MSFASLQKQFQKELKTNPKKAAILGMLALVAIYFWAPLAMKMLGMGGGKSANKPAVVAKADEQITTEAEKQAQNTPSPEPVVIGPGWDKLLKWIKNDPLTKSCPQLKTEHDPFKRVEKLIEIPSAETPLADNKADEPTAEPVRDLSPTALGMQLTSTIVGSRRSVAMIDDRAYVLGHQVVAYDGAEKLQFRLVEINPDRVILSRDDREYVLKMRQADVLTVSEEEDSEL